MNQNHFLHCNPALVASKLTSILRWQLFHPSFCQPQLVKSGQTKDETSIFITKIEPSSMTRLQAKQILQLARLDKTWQTRDCITSLFAHLLVVWQDILRAIMTSPVACSLVTITGTKRRTAARPAVSRTIAIAGIFTPLVVNRCVSLVEIPCR